MDRIENAITLESMFPSLDWSEVKIHVAQKAGSSRPIDVFNRDFNEWQNRWNGSFHPNHCWNRTYVFSIIEIPNRRNLWLFGGLFEVLSYKYKLDRLGRERPNYKLALSEIGEPLIGRLIIEWEKDGRAKGRKPEKMLNNMEVFEVLSNRYSGEDFPGYANINHRYEDLEAIWDQGKEDWYAALSHCHGVYLITDEKTGKRYVGSAYGDQGIWDRWSSYLSDGVHGGNLGLKELLGKRKNAKLYARRYFTFSLLEQASSRASEQFVIQREGFWKEVLLTRGPFGMNLN